MSHHHRKISVTGLGYVGLPLAVAFGLQTRVVGFDVNQTRINDLAKGVDFTNEVSTEELREANIFFTYNPAELRQADFHIVAVPTPVDHVKQPDLTPLIKASETLGKQLKRGDIVVFESTVYPGATEEDCLPILEAESGLKCGVDFFIGYSPERINPGDKEHTLARIQKVVSGCDQNTLEIIAEVYGSVVTAGIHQAPTIKTAEAAKVIENTQRDLNIALMNELALIFHRMGIDTEAVLKAAGTKWNFLPFKPGLVGGHCIGVDPYYLTYKAKQYGYRPEVILAGRRINDGVGKYIAEQTVKEMIKLGAGMKSTRVAVLGLTFKEDIPDIRNTRVVDIIQELESYSITVDVHDPLVEHDAAFEEYGIRLKDWDEMSDYDAIIVAVSHQAFKQLTPEQLKRKFRANYLLVDVKWIYNAALFQDSGFHIWRL